jgi:F-type H+-transporting ATPase subunit b
MPQLDWGTYPSQIFWLFVIFFALWAAMSYGVLPPFQVLLKKRQDTLSSLLQEAQEIQARAQRLTAESKQALQEVREMCGEEIRQQHTRHHQSLQVIKKENAQTMRRHMQEVERTLTSLKKETLEESQLIMPALDEALLKRLYVLYGARKGNRYAS